MILTNQKEGKEVLPVKYISMIYKDHLVSPSSKSYPIKKFSAIMKETHEWYG